MTIVSYDEYKDEMERRRKRLKRRADDEQAGAESLEPFSPAANIAYARAAAFREACRELGSSNE